MMEGIVWETPLNPPKREDYFFKDGRRLVKPYFFEFICNVKNRWAGKTVVDLFAHEFRQRHHDYYVGAVEAGRIQVDGAHVNVTYTVKSSQRISHFVHRHEPPVMGWNISVLKKEDDLVTVWKPPSIPVHPCGQYRKNTVLGILQAEHGLAPLFPVHRLDRLVSGLLILARSAARADLFRQQIEAGKVRKEYVAKVNGVFPEAEQVVDAAIIFDAREGRSSVEAANDDDASSQKGKLARTKFNRISTNGVHSIVKCEPITGRTHQIRVHLQHIGHPIANDSLYLSEAYSDFLVKPPNDSTYVGMGQPAKRSKSSLNVQISNQLSGRKELDVDEDFVIDPMCTNCPNWPPKGYEEHEEGLWLHCVRYSGPDWTYECPYPEWASIK